MESDLFNGALPFPVNFTILSISLILFIGLIAFLRGVIGMFFGLGCMFVGAYCGYIIYPLLPDILSQFIENPSPILVFSLTIISSFCVYLFLRLLVGAFVISPFKKKEKKPLLRGPVGMVLSLIPASALILVLGIAFWTAGTLLSVDYTNSGIVDQPGTSKEVRPFWARWNYAMERDYLGNVIGKIDPLSSRAKGAISNFLVTLMDDSAGAELSKKPKVSRVLRTKGINELANDPEVSELLKKGDHLALINHPKLKAIAADPEVNKLLNDLPVEKIVDESIYEKKEGLLIRKENRMRLDQ